MYSTLPVPGLACLPLPMPSSSLALDQILYVGDSLIIMKISSYLPVLAGLAIVVHSFPHSPPVLIPVILVNTRLTKCAGSQRTSYSKQRPPALLSPNKHSPAGLRARYLVPQGSLQERLVPDSTCYAGYAFPLDPSERAVQQLNLQNLL